MTGKLKMINAKKLKFKNVNMQEKLIGNGIIAFFLFTLP